MYNKARDTKPEACNEDSFNHGIAFAELVSYIEEARKDSCVAPVFKLSELVSLYTSRLEQLGIHTSGRVHSTKLKDRILSYFPDMNAHKQGRDVVAVCNEDIGAALRKACEYDSDNEAVYLEDHLYLNKRTRKQLAADVAFSFDQRYDFAQKQVQT